MSSIQHYAHAAHIILQKKERHERKLAEESRKLAKIRVKLRGRLDDFLEGKQVRISQLSGDFLKQAVVVDGEKRKLDTIRARLDAVKRVRFAGVSS
ncbi:MAG: hypothetical protein V1717_02340 [Candidatus Micrarchaeota archaeon]